MRLELTERAKKFIETLTEEDLEKVTLTENTFESDDEVIHDKFIDFIKIELAKIKEEITEFNKQLRIEHPEYFN
jgi:hypothetical protein